MFFYFVELFPTPTLTTIPADGIVVSGDSLTLTCESTIASGSNETLKYQLKQGENVVRNLTEDGLFTINPVRTSHKGDYTCEATAKNINKVSNKTTVSGKIVMT